MVNFSCQFAWAEEGLTASEILFPGVYMCFWKRLAVELVTGLKQLAIAAVEGLVQSAEDQTKTKGEKEGQFALLTLVFQIRGFTLSPLLIAPSSFPRPSDGATSPSSLLLQLSA